MKRFGSTLALSALTLVAAQHGTCATQCTSDADCGGCGTAGKCSCPDGPGATYPTISCSCVSQPEGGPSGAPNSTDATWPDQFICDIEAFVYPDMSDGVANAKGKFFYDAVGGHSRAEWAPYINGQDTTQVWIGATGATASNYYVKAGPLCLSFPITDPGVAKYNNIGIERADWVDHCAKAGHAKYIAREQVQVDGKAVWVDHWVCHLDYALVNQTITFQNWHSLGVDSLPKGLPLRVTGGNSAPDPQKGSPRLSTVWYSNFTVGDHFSPNDFKRPALICLPVLSEDVELFFGHSVTKSHVYNPVFHQRAHFLLSHTPTASDVARAAQPKPNAHMKGNNFEDAMDKLNDVLLADGELHTRSCSEFNLKELFESMTMLFNARSTDLQEVYSAADDTRNMAHDDYDELVQDQNMMMELVTRRTELYDIVRDGLCHEAVMWYVHHLSEASKEQVKALKLNLPLLPKRLHPVPNDEEYASNRYADQVSCATCHVA